MAGKATIKVLIAASEFEPFTNIGHLGRVVQNISTAVNNRAGGAGDLTGQESGAVSGPAGQSGDKSPAGKKNRRAAVQPEDIEARVVIPKYAGINKKFMESAKPLLEFDAALGRRVYPCSVYEIIYRGVYVYMISCGSYFDREHVYSTVVDDVERYSCFCNAVLAMLSRIDFQPDIIQCHDWQMSYIPTLYKTSRSRRYSDKDIKTLYVIHSMQYQGVCSRYEMLDLLDLPSEFFTPSTLEFYGQANSLKGGLLFSDWLATVSPNHAREIQHTYYGENLEGIIRARSSEITGIMCGIDPKIYDPASDEWIFSKYDASSFKEGKTKNKLWLQEQLGFKPDADIPLMLVIYDELDYDKGIDLVKFVFDDIMSLGVQLIIAGKGKSDYHDFFLAKVAEYHDKVAYVSYNRVVWDDEKWIGIDGGRDGQNACGQESYMYAGNAGQADAGAPDERRCFCETILFSGSDMLLRPSRIEPCGEKHLIALKYGTLPIVRETGGLKDVVVSYDSETGAGNGFMFFNYNAHDMLYTVNRAVDVFIKERGAFDRMAVAGMAINSTWDAAADEYIGIYREFGVAR